MTRGIQRPWLWAVCAALAFVVAIPALRAEAQEDRTVVRRGSSSGESSSRASSGNRESAPARAPARRSSASSSDNDRQPVARPNRSSSDRPQRRQPNRSANRDRGHGHYHSGYYGGYPYRYHHYRYGYYPYYGWSLWWGGWFPYYPVAAVYDRPQERYGALDLDISPEKARVYLDGQLIGVADNYDGFPSYLWLPEGTYDLVFYREGYETLARQYSIYPGVVIDVEDDLVRGEAKLPEDLFAKSTERREERLRRDRERREEAAARSGDDDGLEDWRARARAARQEREGQAAERAESGVYDARKDPARLILEIAPPDASVYLDGRFLGVASDIAEPGGLIIDPGSHELQVVRPGYEPETHQFEVDADGEISLEIELDEAD